jgi:hypothetical protein
MGRQGVPEDEGTVFDGPDADAFVFATGGEQGSGGMEAKGTDASGVGGLGSQGPRGGDLPEADGFVLMGSAGEQGAIR